MKVSGSATLHAPVEAVWAALNDPAVLVRTIPGCERLEQTGPDRYRMTVVAGVASIKGSYDGEVALTDPEPPHRFVLRASGAGAPGTVSAEVEVRLSSGSDGDTELTYAADAVVGGAVGGVGQRVLSGVAKKTAGEFFQAVDAAIAAPVGAETVPAAASTAAPSAAALEPAGAASPAAGRDRTAAQAGTVFSAPAPRRDTPDNQAFLRGAAFGAAVALLGALVGGFLARRR
jgi:carbon monoxide dehydrogenase subunit G